MKTKSLIFALLLAYSLFSCNNQSARDICKEGSSLKAGNKENRDLVCFVSATLIRREENSNDQQTKNNAILSCLVAIEELRRCDKKSNIKFSTTNEAQ